MVTVIYIDVLLFVNVIVNYFLILITTFFTKEPKKIGRTALAAMAGSLFSLVILLPPLNVLLSLAIKSLGAVTMAVIAFGAKNVRRLLRNAVYLFVASALLAGAVIAVGELLENRNFIGRNMGIYINISPLMLIIIALLCYIVMCLIEVIFKKPSRTQKQCRARVAMGNRELKFEALLDSGNQLYDTLTGRDALVLKKSLAPKILNGSQLEALYSEESGGVSAQHLSEVGDFAILPFNSVGGSGLLVGFGAKICEVEIQDGKNITIERPFVAFAEDRLLGDADGIIGCDAVEV